MKPLTLKSIQASRDGKRPRTGREGKSLESLIEHSPGATLIHVGQAARRIGGGKIIAAQGPCDFAGLINYSRQTIVFDAKECHNENRLITNEDKLPEHQRLQLIAFGRAGAIAGLLACQTCREALYWVPWQMLVDRKPSIPWVELHPIGTMRELVAWNNIVNVAYSEMERVGTP